MSLVSFSRNHEYWLRKASERAAATEQLAQQGLTIEPRSQTFRNPSLALAYNQPIRSPSTQPRIAVRGALPGTSLVGSLTARPLASSIRDTSFRSHNSFDSHGAQQHYAAPYSVSALAALEGQAAASHTVIPNQATARPHVERNYRAVGGGHQPPLRPQTAGPAGRSAQLTYREPFELSPAAATSFTPDMSLYRTLPAQAAWSEVEPQSLPMQATLKAPRPAAGLTYRDKQTTANVLARSQTFRPLLATSKSTPTIPANVLLGPPSHCAHTDWLAAGVIIAALLSPLSHH